MKNKKLEKDLKDAISYFSLLTLAVGNLIDTHRNKDSTTAEKVIAWLLFGGVLLFGVFWISEKKKKKHKAFLKRLKVSEQFPVGSYVRKKGKNPQTAYYLEDYRDSEENENDLVFIVRDLKDNTTSNIPGTTLKRSYITVEQDEALKIVAQAQEQQQ